MPYPKAADLWEMPDDDFNRWRRENDLKSLFEQFEKTLPHFDEWLSKYNLTIDYILETNKPGNFFYWDRDTYLVESVKDEYTSYDFIPIEDERHERLIESTKGKSYDGEQSEFIRFKPYFIWIKEAYKIDKPINAGNGGYYETFHYTVGSAPDVPEFCNWTISAGKTVLKLGGTKISNWSRLRNRNLDFTNLDFLEIEGDFFWDSQIEIFYSHCYHVKAKNVVAHFTKFFNCEFHNFAATDSRFYWIEFYNCDIFKAYFENSSINNMIIENCSANSFSFNRVEVQNIQYTPPKKEWHNNPVATLKTVSDNYKRFRIVYQSNGLRDEVSNAYYNERLYEMKYRVGSLRLRFVDSVKYFRHRKHDFESSYFHIKHYFSELIKIISDAFSCTIWGFGERPLRILSTCFQFITVYSLIYYFSGNDKLTHNIVNSLYLSIVSFTTLGFGDITPTTDLLKLIVGSEAILGAFCIGLIVAGFANKSRY